MHEELCCLFNLFTTLQIWAAAGEFIEAHQIKKGSNFNLEALLKFLLLFLTGLKWKADHVWITSANVVHAVAKNMSSGHIPEV